MASSIANLDINGLSEENLTKLLEDEEYFESFVKKLPQVQNMEREKESLMVANKALAEQNLAYEPRLGQNKSELIELYEKARGLSDELETKRAQLDSLSTKTSLDTTHTLLLASCAEAEEESEALAEKFLDRDLDMDTFLTQFPQLKIKAHLRKLKVDKMAEIINMQRTRPTFNTPYPTTTHMPLPHPQ